LGCWLRRRPCFLPLARSSLSPTDLAYIVRAPRKSVNTMSTPGIQFRQALLARTPITLTDAQGSPVEKIGQAAKIYLGPDVVIDKVGAFARYVLSFNFCQSSLFREADFALGDRLIISQRAARRPSIDHQPPHPLRRLVHARQARSRLPERSKSEWSSLRPDREEEAGH
jgi:hypothetical protein